MSEGSETQILPAIVVLGSWSSGTTAVTGYLARLGAYPCPPTTRTTDPRTPDSHESVDFALQLMRVFDEASLKEIGDRQGFADWLGPWLVQRSAEAAAAGYRRLVLKHPLCALMIPEIHRICQPKFLVVTRPFFKIEETRARRNWHPSYGAAGANIIYSRLFSGLIEIQASCPILSFGDFVKDRALRGRLVADLGLTPDSAQIDAAESWIR